MLIIIIIIKGYGITYLMCKGTEKDLAQHWGPYMSQDYKCRQNVMNGENDGISIALLARYHAVLPK